MESQNYRAQATEAYYFPVYQPTFMGLGGWLCFIALVMVGCGHLFNWLGRTRYALSWHDVNEVRTIERLRNGVYSQLPWHPPRARVNQLPVMKPIGQSFDLNRVSALAELPPVADDVIAPAHTTSASVAPGLQPLAPVAASEDSGPSDGGLNRDEIQQINRLVFATDASLNRVAQVMEASKNSKRYHLVRAQWQKAKKLRSPKP